MAMKTVLSWMMLAGMITTAWAEAEQALFDFSKAETAQYVMAQDARLEADANALSVHTRHTQDWPGVTIRCPGDFWDCTGFQRICAELANTGDVPATVYLRVDNPGADGVQNCLTQSMTISPGQTKTLSVDLYATPWTFDKPVELVGMRGYPQPSRLRTDRINQLLFFVAKPQRDYHFKISLLRAEGTVTVLNSETFFPFIDRFGQFIHTDWPGKIDSEEDLLSRKEAEKAEFAARPAASERDSWGGWSAGPQLEATGFFRAEKVGGQWWLVDPDGRLFWSHGVDCVGTSSETPVTGRENYFQWLVRDDSPARLFWGRSDWAPVGDYKDKGSYETYNFAGVNLQRKYGRDWYSAHAEICHLRLAGWGMNTIGNWSEEAIYRLRKTPYTATLSAWAKPIEGSEGYWGKFPDPFDSSFAANFRKAVEREKGNSIGDPWCIGFFVDNELAWGDEVSLAMAALTSPAGQPAKKEFIERLKKKYTAVEALNAAWGSSYGSWENLAEAKTLPDKTKAQADMKAFYTVIAERYFETIRQELKAAAPNQIYFGCRFAWGNESAIRAAAKYCDVISFNQYEYSVADFRLPEGVDKAVIIGEFHFGALDRGMFHTGLKETRNQNDRAQKYKEYVLGALRNPAIVGTHWFQYRDQATTGRGDGENYQIGLVDICDTPYPEPNSAVQEVGQLMYEYRYRTSQIKD
jgi:hypothetical protein